MITEKVEPLHPDIDQRQWRLRMVNISLSATDSSKTDYYGLILESVHQDQSHFVEFTFKTRATRLALIDISLWVSTSAQIRLFVNDDPIGAFGIADSKDSAPVLHHLTLDVTRWAEARVESRLRLHVFYEGRPGTTHILWDSDQIECSPRLRHRWVWSYTLPSVLFFGSIWGTILGLAIFLVANIQAIGDAFRFYAVLITVGVWAMGAVGIPDIAKIPLRQWLRRLYSWSRSYRSFFVTAVSLLLMVFVILDAPIIYCLFIRHSYTKLINTALHALERPDSEEFKESIRKAFIMLPWRKESQFLFEIKAYHLRGYEYIRPFRQYVSAFVWHPDVKEIVEDLQLDYTPSCCLRNVEGGFDNPILWYTSILLEAEPEAENDGQESLIERAIKILPLTDYESLVQKEVLELSKYFNDLKKSREIASELQSLLLKAENFDKFMSSHVYQIACDALAVCCINLCDLQEAVQWFKRERKARLKLINWNHEYLWHRPPHKLLLFHVFMHYAKSLEEVDHSRARDLLNSGSCDQRFEDYFKQDLYHEDLAQPETWKVRTILGGNIKDYIGGKMLDDYWRY